MHIGRTAGTTLSRVLWRQYPRPAIHKLEKSGFDRAGGVLASLSEHEKRGIRLITGHGCFGLHQLLPQPATYLTILRDPVQRAISHYNYVCKWPMHPLHERVTREGMNLLEYVSSGIAPEVENFQTRVVSGWPASPYGDSPDGLLEQAKRNMESHFSLVGLSERFDETLLLLAHMIGSTRLWYEPLNVDGHPRAAAALQDEAIDCIARHNQLDTALYQHAKLRFDAELARIPERHELLRRMCWQNRLHRPWTKAYRRAREAKLHVESRLRRRGPAAG